MTRLHSSTSQRLHRSNAQRHRHRRVFAAALGIATVVGIVTLITLNAPPSGISATPPPDNFATSISAGSALTVTCSGPEETQTRLSKTQFLITCQSPTPPGTTTTVPSSPTTSAPANQGSSATRTVPAGPEPITAGDSKADCIYVGGDDEANVDGVEQLTGHRFNCIETFTDADTTWSDWTDAWIADQGGFTQWVEQPGHQLIVTQNLVPDSVATQNGWETTCASGAYDSYDKQFATKLIDAGMGSSVIRLGHEMNGNWYTDSLPDTIAGDAAWAQCFATIVTQMRSVRGAHFLFDWDVNPAVRPIDFASYYPGNQYVDIIGIDLYDQFGDTSTPPSVTAPDRFNALAAQPDSLDDLEAFAAAHGKPVSFPEWSTVLAQGDDPDYVNAMANFTNTHDVAYQSWFDDGAGGTAPLGVAGNSQSTAAYISHFG
jgi:hypothetical protein